MVETKPKERIARVMFTHFGDGEVWPYSDELEWQSFSSLDVIRRVRTPSDRKVRIRKNPVWYAREGLSDDDDDTDDDFESRPRGSGRKRKRSRRVAPHFVKAVADFAAA